MDAKSYYRAVKRSADVWINAALLIAVNYTDQIMQAVNDNLPALSSYLPPNVYKAVGIAVVVANIVRAAHSTGKRRECHE